MARAKPVATTAKGRGPATTLTKVRPEKVAPSRARSRGLVPKVVRTPLQPSKKVEEQTRARLASGVLLAMAPFALAAIVLMIIAPDHAASMEVFKYVLPSVMSICSMVLGYYFGRHDAR